MNMIERSFPYRGTIKSIASSGKMLVWTTEHPQKLPTALYQWDSESDTFTEVALPCGGVSILANESTIWVAGNDRKLYVLNGKTLKPLCELPGVAISLAQLSQDRLAAIVQSSLCIVDSKKGALTQTISLSDSATALASDPTGDWLAVGLNNGIVSVYCSSPKNYDFFRQVRIRSCC
jgi:ParB family transcriptional regulator, chromosome partitioning protein